MRELVMIASLLVACARPVPEAPRPDPFGARPVLYDAALIIRVRGIGTLPDHSEVMAEKARLLIAVANLSDRELTELAGVPKTFLRELAVGFLAHSNLYGNIEEARAFLNERVRTSTDEREQLLMAPVFRDVLRSKDARAIALAWLDWIERALVRMPHPVALELAHARIVQLGRAGTRLGVATQVRGLCDAIIAAGGAFALTATGGERELFQAAVAARYDLEHPSDPYYIEELPRARFDLWAAYRDAPRAASDAEFDRLAAPLLAPQIHFDMQIFETIATCFALSGVSVDRRARLLLRLLSLRADELGAFDPRGAPDFVVLPRGLPEVFAAAAHALATNPDLLADGAVRREVAELAVRPLEHDHDAALYELQPLFVAVLRELDVASARPILASWMQVVRDAATRKDGDLYYTTNIAIARLLALVELGPRAGLDVAPLIEEVAASPQPSPGARYTHAVLVRGAAIARATLTLATRGMGKQVP